MAVIDSTDYVEAQEGSKSLKFPIEKQQANFELGVSMIIYSWEALDIAVANQWGGAQSEAKRDWITAIVLDLFDEKIVDVELIEETILNAMIDEFDVNVEDDSSLIIADRIIKIYRKCFDQDYKEVHELYSKWEIKQKERSARNLNITINEDPLNPDSSDDDDDDDEDDEEPSKITGEPIDEDVEMGGVDEPQGPIVDDDGFELVQKKGKKRN
ncbi:Pre-rRNA-processing protein [Wickerhamomyces ciferrii]|uniref:Pre-rRNA-processing protein n=1 Tax=Wickerhamomyces ciferrii (strain ATCC 14091 / BCRC 22168 / CBS 111 / JCM 3599 / NBRC 0793 / NRRL Y-1031 F-60-10) TaxID=1206466 RepID=K0KEI5_WICCF|nr:Pre-rRNA-processing protein [Wickerhamomyces ciferrii]CCH43550.1 Pre-rRNA-processing protein [Wickerhamomyces ciferrii]